MAISKDGDDTFARWGTGPQGAGSSTEIGRGIARQSRASLARVWTREGGSGQRIGSHARQTWAVARVTNPKRTAGTALPKILLKTAAGMQAQQYAYTCSCYSSQAIQKLSQGWHSDTFTQQVATLSGRAFISTNES